MPSRAPTTGQALALMLLSFSVASLAVAQPVEGFVRWTGRVTLEESPEFMIVAPRAIAERDGLVVVDVREFRVARFAFNGALSRRLGRKGSGPGEFESPPLTARSNGGGLVVAEFGGRLHLFGEGERPATTMRVPVFPFYDAVAFSNEVFLLAGWGPLAQRERTERAKLLHVWSAHEQRVVRSFFDVPMTDEFLAIARSLGNASVVLSGDTVSATFSLSDTIYHFAVSTGRMLGRTPIRSSLLKRPDAAPGGFADAAARAKWLEGISVIDALHRLDDGRWLVQFSERFGAARRYRLLLLNPQGDVVGSATEAPQLLAVRSDVRPVQLFFKASDDEEPNVWKVAVLK